MACSDGTSLVACSKTESINWPSVTDDGEEAVFVAGHHRLNVLSIVAERNRAGIRAAKRAIWQSVTVSKDGTKLAAVTTSADASIYVYDFGQKKWSQFNLYNPTYTEGVTTGACATPMRWSGITAVNT